MNQARNVSVTSCILEHADGVSELWVRSVEEPHFTVYEPVRLRQVSGTRRIDLSPHTITDALALDEWCLANPDVFSEGRTSDRDSGDAAQHVPCLSRHRQHDVLCRTTCCAERRVVR